MVSTAPQRARPGNTSSDGLSRKRLLSASKPMRWPKVPRGTVVTLSTIRRLVLRRPFSGVGSTGMRRTGRQSAHWSAKKPRWRECPQSCRFESSRLDEVCWHSRIHRRWFRCIPAALAVGALGPFIYGINEGLDLCTLWDLRYQPRLPPRLSRKRSRELRGMDSRHPALNRPYVLVRSATAAPHCHPGQRPACAPGGCSPAIVLPPRPASISSTSW